MIGVCEVVVVETSRRGDTSGGERIRAGKSGGNRRGSENTRKEGEQAYECDDRCHWGCHDEEHEQCWMIEGNKQEEIYISP